MTDKVVFVDFGTQPRAIERAQIARSLQERDLIVDITGAPHVAMGPSVPQVPDRGWLDFLGNWNIFSKPPEASARCFGLSQDYPGKLDIWLDNLSPGAKYVVAIDVASEGSGPPSAFEIRTSAGAQRTVTAMGEQSLLLQIQPARALALVSLTTRNLPGGFSFYATEVFRVK